MLSGAFPARMVKTARAVGAAMKVKRVPSGVAFPGLAQSLPTGGRVKGIVSPVGPACTWVTCSVVPTA